MLTKRKQLARWSSLVIFLGILTMWMWQTKTIHESWNESSRLASIQSLVEHDTWRIDASPYGHQTGDKMLIGGHYYSEKPPLFAAMGAVFYALMYHGLGATLAIEGCQPGSICVYYWLTVLMVGLPSAIMTALFYRLVHRQTGSSGWAAGLTLLLCFGTIVWPYSLVFNHHLPAAIAMFISFYLLFRFDGARLHLFLAGLLVGLAVMLDLTSVFLAAALFLIVVIYHRYRGILIFSGAALIPLAVTLIFNYQITGSFLFAYFFQAGYNFPGSPWDTTVGGQHPPDNVFLYIFRSLIGDRGVLAYSPLLIFALGGLVKVAVKPWGQLWTRQKQVKSALILSGLMGHFFFVLTRTNHFGGDAYGWRFFIPVIPVLYFFIVAVVPACFFRSGGGWVAVLGGAAALVAVFSAYQGVRATWHQISPPVFVALLPEPPYVNLAINLSLSQYPLPNPSKDEHLRRFDLPSISHRLDLNINDELVLLGYDLPTRRVEPGQKLELRLYWQSQRVVLDDYFVFTHLFEANQIRLGGLDRRLQEGYPLKFWYPGEIVTDDRQIPVDVNAPNGLAWLRVGVYEPVDGQAKPVPLIGSTGQGEETSIAIGSVLIGNSPFVIGRDDLKPQTSLAVPWGNPSVIMLRGYDLVRAEGNLHLTLYWESVTLSQVDYTIFVHLLDHEKKITTQVDQPPAGGQYPTSLWQAGEIVRDEVTLPISAPLKPGRYEVQVGWYDPATGARLVVPGEGENSFPLATLEIE